MSDKAFLFMIALSVALVLLWAVNNAQRVQKTATSPSVHVELAKEKEPEVESMFDRELRVRIEQIEEALREQSKELDEFKDEARGWAVP